MLGVSVTIHVTARVKLQYLEALETRFNLLKT